MLEKMLPQNLTFIFLDNCFSGVGQLEARKKIGSPILKYFFDYFLQDRFYPDVEFNG